MNRLAIILICALTAVLPGQAREAVEADTVTAAQALVAMPAQTLDILTTSMRLDLIDYYRADSIYRVPNAMEGLSYLRRPMTPQYLQVQVTPVTKFTIRILPRKNDFMVATVYTIGDSLQAADSEIRFYDAQMKELKRSKFIKLLSTEDFFDFSGVDGKTRRELLSIVPFPTVEYTFSPDGTDLKARLTVGEFLGKEDLEKITPYLRRDRLLRWDGARYRLQPLTERP